MAGFNGSGTYVRNFNWVNDKTNGINITASRFDTEDNGYATGLSSVICKDGQTTCSAVIPFAQGVSVAAGSASAPGLAIIGNTGSGLYQPTTGQIGIAAASSGVALFTSTGLNATNIGATTPGTGNFTTLTATSIVGPISANAVGKVAVTQPATGSTITVVDGKTLTANHTFTINGGDSAVLAIAASKTLTVSNSLTLAGTDSTSMTFPGTTDTVVTLTATQTLTNKTLTSPTITTGALGSSTATTQSANDNSTKVATTAYADAAAAALGGIVLLTTVNASATASVVFNSTFVTSTYNKYLIEFDGMFTASGDALQFSVSKDNGSSTTAPISNVFYANSSSASVANVNSNAFLTVSVAGGNLAQATSGSLKFSIGSGTVAQSFDWTSQGNLQSGTQINMVIRGAGVTALSAAMNYIKIVGASASNITGNFHLYGIKGT